MDCMPSVKKYLPTILKETRFCGRIDENRTPSLDTISNGALKLVVKIKSDWFINVLEVRLIEGVFPAR